MPQDVTAAFNWFLAASEAGNKEAQYELSKAYSRGQGTKENVTEALRWLEESAGAGHLQAQYFLANAYENGPEAFRDAGRAVDWYRRAAEGGFAIAQRTLGTKYLTGDGSLAPDATEAVRWLEAAAERGDPGAAQNLAIGYLSGEVLPQDDQKAAKWFERASTSGLGRSSLAYGQLLEAGRGVEKDFEAAIKYYVKAVSESEKRAALLLGRKAVAGELEGYMAAQTAVPLVGLVLQEESDEAARDWLQEQATAGNRPAQRQLGLWYLAQEDGAKDAAPLLDAAAWAGDVEAQFQLGKLYTTGTGVSLDYVSAHKWLNVAGAAGHSEALEMRAVVANLMTPDQVAEAQSGAREFLQLPEIVRRRPIKSSGTQKAMLSRRVRQTDARIVRTPAGIAAVSGKHRIVTRV
ncbi:SEL1-like repeat protein [Sulfitobacter aestuariivivens]|uniref:SEL1-like repeat protein n=1 Tax=Sulfitobacter aestuariivivens TaxID=2766981 RepID=UPI003605D8AA